MPPASQAARTFDGDQHDRFVESDFVRFHNVGKRMSAADAKDADDIRVDIDLGSNSVKLAVHQNTDDGLVDITKETVCAAAAHDDTAPIKPSVLCGLGRDAKPNKIEIASLNDEAMAMVVDEVLPNFMTVITHLKRQGAKIRLGVVATAAVRNSLKNPSPEGHEKTVAFLESVENVTGVSTTIASEKLEIDLSIDAVMLTDHKTRNRRPRQGVMHYGGGNSIQVAKIVNDQTASHTGLLQIGSRSLKGKPDITKDVNQAIANDAPWLDSDVVEKTDAIFGGGTFRLPGRGLALLMHGTNPATEHMPTEGYTFSFASKRDLQTIRTNLLKLQKMTANELFARAFGTSKAEFCAKIAAVEEKIESLSSLRDAVAGMDEDLAHSLLKRIDSDRDGFIEAVNETIDKKDHIKIGDDKFTIKEAKKLLTKWESKIEKRFPDLKNDVDFVLGRLTRMYGENGEKLDGDEYSVTFSGGNTRLAMAALN